MYVALCVLIEQLVSAENSNPPEGGGGGEGVGGEWGVLTEGRLCFGLMVHLVVGVHKKLKTGTDMLCKSHELLSNEATYTVSQKLLLTIAKTLSVFH